MEQEKKPYTWAQLKDFCNGLSEEQLTQSVEVVQEDSNLRILEAAEIGQDYYKFDDEDYSISAYDFNYEYHLDGKYTSFQEALDNLPFILTPKTAVFLFDDF